MKMPQKRNYAKEDKARDIRSDNAKMVKKGDKGLGDLVRTPKKNPGKKKR